MPRPTQVAALMKLLCLYGSFTLCGPTFQTVPVQRFIPLAAPTTPAAP